MARESRLNTASAPASKRAASPLTNCGPIATTRSLISSCTPLAYPKYTFNGAVPAIALTLFARPLPANRRRPAESCTSTHESAEKLRRRRAGPVPGTESVSCAAPLDCGKAAGLAAVAAGSAGRSALSCAPDATTPLGGDALAGRPAGAAALTVDRWCHGRHQMMPPTATAMAAKAFILAHDRPADSCAVKRIRTFEGCNTAAAGEADLVSYPDTTSAVGNPRMVAYRFRCPLAYTGGPMR